jgi:hypothetical protein
MSPPPKRRALSELFVPILRAVLTGVVLIAGVPALSGAQALDPLSVRQIETLLRIRVPEAQIRIRLQQRCLSSIAESDRGSLRAAGASDTLITFLLTRGCSSPTRPTDVPVPPAVPPEVPTRATPTRSLMINGIRPQGDTIFVGDTRFVSVRQLGPDGLQRTGAPPPSVSIQPATTIEVQPVPDGGYRLTGRAPGTATIRFTPSANDTWARTEELSVQVIAKPLPSTAVPNAAMPMNTRVPTWREVEDAWNRTEDARTLRDPKTKRYPQWASLSSTITTVSVELADVKIDGRGDSFTAALTIKYKVGGMNSLRERHYTVAGRVRLVGSEISVGDLSYTSVSR